MSALLKPSDIKGYTELRRWLNGLKQANRISEWATAVRWYIENDIFFLINDVVSDGRVINSETGTPLYFNQFYIDWCRQIEWQLENGGGFDGSARGSGKSTLRTKCGNIQRMIRYPNSTGCIFSFQRKFAKKHFRGIKEELETNTLLKVVCDDVLFEDPVSAAKNNETVWSLEDGLRVKRSQQRKDNSLEYNAFFNGTPTGGRFDQIDFDDIEDKKSVSNEDMLRVLHATYDASVVLLTPVAITTPVEMFTNTFYSDSGLAKRVYERCKNEPDRVRIMPGEDLETPGEGPMGGTPVYPFTPSRLFMFYTKIKDKSEYAVQICCSFRAGEDRSLKPDWLLKYPGLPDDWGKNKNIYICIDPSRGVKDPMVIWVWALGADKKASWVDCSMKRLDPALPEFGDEILKILAKWTNLGKRVVEIRVENFGQSTYDVNIQKALNASGFYVKVVACADNMRTGKFTSGKRDREFERWAGPAAIGDVLIPVSVKDGGPGLVRPDEKGVLTDLVSYFVDEEWSKFPHPLTDNMLDAGSLLWEPEAKVGPLSYPTLSLKKKIRNRFGRSYGAMSAG